MLNTHIWRAVLEQLGVLEGWKGEDAPCVVVSFLFIFAVQTDKIYTG